MCTCSPVTDIVNIDTWIDTLILHETISDTGWTTVSFDFSQAFISGTSNIISADGGYSKMVVFVNGPVAQPGTYFVDDITYANYESVDIYQKVMDITNGEGVKCIIISYSTLFGHYVEFHIKQ